MEKTIVTVIIVVLLILASLCIYFLPSIIAKNKKHKQLQSIFILNLFLGWSFLGWVVALIWAFSKEK